MSTFCEFGDQLDNALRDRLVCGLKSEAIQKRLLAVKDLTFKDALDMAQGMEAADRNTKDLQVAEASAVNQLKSRPRPQTHPRSTPATKGKNSQPCYRCGKTNHQPHRCRFIEANCRACGKKGHIAAVCRSKKGAGSQNVQAKAHMVKLDSNNSEDDDSELYLFTLKSGGKKAAPITVEVHIEGVLVEMEVDTGAEVSVVSEKTWQKYFPEQKLRPSRVVLKTYTDGIIPVVGEVRVNVRYGNQSAELPLIVVSGVGHNLMGRDWLRSIRLDWKSIARVSSEKPKSLEALIENHKEIFKKELGTFKGPKAKLQVQPSAIARFHKPRTVPFTIKEAVGNELDRLEAEGILQKVDHSEWAAPIVPVPKKDGSHRICGDYKVTVNPVLDIDQYPLPKPTDLFTALAGGNKFSTLDLTQAYQQLLLDEDSRRYTTINTHKGLYQYTRLPFGIASAPALFQKMMDTLLQGIPHMSCFLDDIIVTGANDEEHLENLREVFKRLESHGLRLKKSKCKFLQSSVEYLGHRINSQGLHAMTDKLEAIKGAPEPENIQQLRSFLGLLNYYGKFIPNLASLLHPLNELLRQDTPWVWDEHRAQAFTEAKQALTSSSVLMHYDPTLPISLAGDASPYGIGAVISHTLPDGSERPIAFASRTLTASERNYAQLEKEALSLIYGVKKFHQYLYGRRFTLITDHKPLLTILGPKTGIPSLAAARLQRWAVLLSAYKYDIKFRATGNHANADSLSRLPLTQADIEGDSPEASIFNVSQLNSLPVTASQVQNATKTDPDLRQVWNFVREGWPKEIAEQLKPFFNRKDELTMEGDCILWGVRVVIPRKLRSEVLQELHRNHPGISRMKSIARSYVWWPSINHDIEDTAKGCSSCQGSRNSPSVAPLHPWSWPARPWERIHLDFAGPFLNRMFLVLVDAHSKWPEVHEMRSTTTESTVQVLRHLFSSYGLPRQIVTDNGPQFTLQEFAEFMKENGIKHTKCSPYHPSSNGLAERFVQTFKQAMKAGKSDQMSLDHRLTNFLLGYRSTPHATTNQTPCSLFLKREIRTRLDLLKPSCSDHVLKQQSQQVQQHDRHAKLRELEIGQLVWVRDFRTGSWIAGTIDGRRGPLSYVVQTEMGPIWRRHIDQLLTRKPGNKWEKAVTESTKTDSSASEAFALVDSHNSQRHGSPMTHPQTVQSQPSSRYPTRERHPPDRFTF